MKYLNPLTGEMNTLDLENPMPGIYAGVSQEDYLKIRAVSRTTIKHFRDSKEKILFPEDKETDAMIFGTQYHAYIFEFDAFSAHFREGPEFKRSNADKEAYADLCEKMGGARYVYRPSHLEKIQAMREALRRYPKIDALLTNDHPKELTIVFYHEASELMCKKRDDVLVMDPGWSIDLKTTKDPEWDSFRWDIPRFGYDLQAGFYVLGNSLTPGLEHAEKFAIVAQSKEHPFTARSWRMDVFIQDSVAESNRLLLEFAEWRDAGMPLDDEMGVAKNYSF